MCPTPFLCPEQTGISELESQLGVVVEQLWDFAVGGEFLLKAANVFIIWCVVRESDMSGYDAYLSLSTKPCVLYAFIFNG